MKNFNWGHGITVFYILFVCTVVFVLVSSFSVDHSLVVDDYYAKDIAYQTRYNKEVRSLETNNLIIQKDDNNNVLLINIKGEEDPKGQIHFYRPSDKTLDFTKEIESKSTRINTSTITPGKWILKIDWSDEAGNYYSEQTLFI